MILRFTNNIIKYGSGFLNYTGVTPSTLVTTATLNNATIVAQSPFTGASSGNSYSVTGSSSSYVSVSGQTGFAMGTGDFTVEWFQYETDTNSFPRIFWYGSGPSFGMSLETAYYVWPPATNLGAKGIITNAWHHLALVRISGRAYIYKDGTLVTGAGGVVFNANITDTTSTFVIGAKIAGATTEQFKGYITNFRVVKGLGVYTGNFTTPTSPLTAIASANPYGGSNTSAIPYGYTSLLLTP